METVKLQNWSWRLPVLKKSEHIFFELFATRPKKLSNRREILDVGDCVYWEAPYCFLYNKIMGRSRMTVRSYYEVGFENAQIALLEHSVSKCLKLCSQVDRIFVLFTSSSPHLSGLNAGVIILLYYTTQFYGVSRKFHYFSRVIFSNQPANFQSAMQWCSFSHFSTATLRFREGCVLTFVSLKMNSVMYLTARIWHTSLLLFMQGFLNAYGAALAKNLTLRWLWGN